MTDQHHIIPGRVGSKQLEWQLLMAEILQRPVGQFVTAAFIVPLDLNYNAKKVYSVKGVTRLEGIF